MEWSSKSAENRKIIKDLLDIDIEVIEYLPNALDVATEQDKKSVFDVICKNTGTGEVFVLEMQTTYESDMNDRLYYYAGSLIHNQVQSGDVKYSINSVLILCVASYRVTHRQRVPEGKVFFKYGVMESETHEVFDGDKLKLCFLELDRFRNYLDNNSDLKEQWCWFFNNLSNFAVRPECLDPSFDDMISKSSTRNLTLEEKLAYMEARTLNERERLVIREGGYIEGAEHTLQSVALAMVNDGMSPELIAKYTGLSIEAIKSLSEEAGN